jgi:phage recombination protein Bet
VSTALATTTGPAVVNTDEKPIQFTPLGGSDAIKLSVTIIQNLLAVKTKRGFTCSRAEATKFLMMCQARRLNPFEGDAFLIGYDTDDGPSFSLITAHQAFLKRAELYPAFMGMDSGIIVREAVPELSQGETPEPVDGNRMDPGLILRLGQHQWRLQRGDFYVDGQIPVGGWATVKVKDKEIPTHRRLRIERFNKGFAEWKKDPAGMICKCAEADALRSAFPTQCGGMYMAGEMPQTPQAMSEIADLTQTARGLVDRSAPASQQVITAGDSAAKDKSADEAAEASAGLAPAAATAAAADAKEPAPANSVQDQLAAIVHAAGFTFGEWRVWAMAEKHIKDPELPGFELVSDAVATRLIRAKIGMVEALKKARSK